MLTTREFHPVHNKVHEINGLYYQDIRTITKKFKWMYSDRSMYCIHCKESVHYEGISKSYKLKQISKIRYLLIKLFVYLSYE